MLAATFLADLLQKVQKVLSATMSELRVDFDYTPIDPSKGISFERRMKTMMVRFNLLVTSIALVVGAAFLAYGFWRGAPLNNSINVAIIAFIISWPIAWIVVVRFRVQESLKGDNPKIISMNKRRSVILSGDQIRYTDESESIDYTVSQLKKIEEEQNNVTIKFRGAPQIFIVKNRVVEGDLNALIAHFRSHLKQNNK